MIHTKNTTEIRYRISVNSFCSIDTAFPGNSPQTSAVSGPQPALAGTSQQAVSSKLLQSWEEAILIAIIPSYAKIEIKSKISPFQVPHGYPKIIFQALLSMTHFDIHLDLPNPLIAQTWNGFSGFLLAPLHSLLTP